MEPLRVKYLQTDVEWEAPEANLRRFSSLLAQSSDPADLIILPEMFATGYSMQPERVVQKMNGQAVTWMTNLSAETGACVMGSLAIQEDDRYLNRLICAHPDGSLSFYDKKHLFTFAGEHHKYSAGGHHLQVEIKGWRVMPLVCYDLRFPVWCRNVSNYDVLLFVANWPSPRIHAWTALLQARAIENQCYVVGVNRIGDDPNGNHYSGQSACYDMAGKVVHESFESPEMATMKLDHAALVEFRTRFAFLADRDEFHLL